MANKDYSKARATKSESSRNVERGKVNITDGQKKKAVKKIKKSPLLMISLIFLVIGLVGGYFAFTKLSSFEMQGFSVNGVASEEKDYVEIDMTDLEEKYSQEKSDYTMAEFYESIILEDGGTTCKFFGVDVSKTVSVKYYYREDISQEAEFVEGIDLTKSGVFYVEYTSSHFMFKNSKLIRTIVVTGV